MKYYNRVGEPFGILVLAIAVTVIEVALIVSGMVAGKTSLRNPSSRRGFCGCHTLSGSLLISGALHHEQELASDAEAARAFGLFGLLTNRARKCRILDSSMEFML
jgi:Ca2+:H+ antiporter